MGHETRKASEVLMPIRITQPHLIRVHLISVGLAGNWTNDDTLLQ